MKENLMKKGKLAEEMHDVTTKIKQKEEKRKTQ